CVVVFIMIRRPRVSTLFPYTTLFRSVGDFLVLGKRVGDQRKGALVFLEGFGKRIRRRLALLAGAVLHEIQRRLDRQFLAADLEADRKSTRLNSSHVEISYAVFCLKKK